MSSSLSGIILNTSLTSHHMSWGKFSRTLHVLNEDIVDEIQLKART
ncbi:TPA: secretion protein EspH, partial [Escherichia coli]